MTAEVRAAAPERRTTYREVLAHREFTAVLVAWLVSMLGNVVSHVALSFLVFSRTRSPLLAALAFSIGWLPHLLVGTLLSGLPDRVPARRLMVSCELASAVVVGLMVVPGLPVAALLGLVLLEGCITPVFMAARGATLPDLLPGDHYVVGRALLGLVAQGSQIVGYALGAALLAVVAPTTALALDAASFAVSALVLRLGTPARPAARAGGDASLAGASLSGLAALFRHRRVRALLLLGWLAPMVGVVPESVAVPLSAAQHRGGSGASVLLVCVAAGVIGGELLVARLLRPTARVRAMPWLALTMFVPLLAFVARPPLPVAGALLVVSGVGWAHGLAQSQLFLHALPTELRARGLTVAGSGAMLTQALGFVAGGAAAELLAPTDVVAVGGALGLVVVPALLLAVRRSGTTGDDVTGPAAAPAPVPAPAPAAAPTAAAPAAPPRPAGRPDAR